MTDCLPGAERTPPTPPVRSRWASHLLALGAVGLLVATSALLAPPRAPRAQAASLAQASVPSGSEATLPEWLRPPLGGGAQTLPEWLASAQETGLWSGTDDRALFFGTLPAGALLKPMGRYQAGRLLVYYAGDGATHPAGQAWVDAAAVAPAEAPPTARAAAPEAPALRPLPVPPTRVKSAAPLPVTARSVVVIDDASGAVLYEERARERVPPASTTKIATTITALEMPGVNVDQVITATVSGSRMAALDGSSIMGLEPGEQVSLLTLLYGMMLPSGNDAAEQVAVTLGGGSRSRFVDLMNQKVASLGLTDTHFASPSGMDTPGHYSSAYDMAMLARYAMRNAAFRAMAGAARYQGDGYLLKNANRLIGYYGGADGVKIGYTDEARKTIVASATRNGRRVYVGLMRSEDLVYDSVALLDWAWDTFTWQ